MPSKAFFVADVLYRWIAQMFEEEIQFGNSLLKQSGTVLAHLTLVTLTFDPKINRVSLLPRIDVGTKCEEGKSRRSQVLDHKQFWHIWPGYLDLWPLNQKGFICYPGWMCGPSLKKVCQGVLELLIGNEKVTDGQTFQPTDRHVQRAKGNMQILLTTTLIMYMLT